MPTFLWSTVVTQSTSPPRGWAAPPGGREADAHRLARARPSCHDHQPMVQSSQLTRESAADRSWGCGATGFTSGLAMLIYAPAQQRQAGCGQEPHPEGDGQAAAEDTDPACGGGRRLAAAPAPSFCFASARLQIFTGTGSSWPGSGGWRTRRLSSTVSSTEATTEKRIISRHPGQPPSGRMCSRPGRMRWYSFNSTQRPFMSRWLLSPFRTQSRMG
jgi:hypothetical protein